MTEHFSLRELTRSFVADIRKINNAPSQEAKDNLKMLAQNVLEPLRAKFGAPLYVSSGFRSEALNKAVKGAKNSQHLFGQAADLIACAGAGESKKQANKRLFNVARQMIESGEITVGQLIDEKNFAWVHVSLPTERLKNQILHL